MRRGERIEFTVSAARSARALAVGARVLLAYPVTAVRDSGCAALLQAALVMPKKEERLARVSPSTPRREGCRIRPPRKRPTYRCERLGHASVVLVRLQRAGLLLGEVLLGANLRRAREAGGERKSGERRADGEARRTNA